MSASHECRQGRRCRSRRRDQNNEWQPALIEHRGLCRPCEDDAFDAIRQLWLDWKNLGHAIPDKLKRGTPQIGGTNETPSPLNLPALTLWETIHQELSRWSNIVTGGDPLPTRIDEYTYRAYVNVTSRLGTLIDQPLRRYRCLLPHPFGGDHEAAEDLDGVDITLRLARLHHDTLKILGEVETRIWLADPCHVCGIKSLTPSRDQQTITCRNCRNVWDAHQFAALQTTLDYNRRDVKHA